MIDELCHAGLPDFIIGGAMKCGTSSLHHILAQHPSIFIPDGEQDLFAIDDIEQHPYFFPWIRGSWYSHNYEQNLERYLEWYRSLFSGRSGSETLLGEDSTAYLSSAKAPCRIAKVLPNVKLIFLLRDPVERTYSHYWHWVKTGRAIYGFEETLRYAPATLLQRSFYKTQIERYFACFPRDRIKIILFEQFVQHTERVVDDVLEFLGVDRTMDLSTISKHKNQGQRPRCLWLRLLRNRILRHLAGLHYWGWLPDLPQAHRTELVRCWPLPGPLGLGQPAARP